MTIVETTAADEAQPIHPQVTATLVPGTATQVSVRAGDHSFTVDEPESLGGTDVGANPVEHLLAALGSCQVISYQVWAEKLGLRLDEVDVSLGGDLDLRGFFGLNPDVRPGFASIDAQVRLAGPESAERYAELYEAVEQHCPVLDNLGNAVPVTTTITTTG